MGASGIVDTKWKNETITVLHLRGGGKKKVNGLVVELRVALGH
jgi:hypothetical protein